MLYLIIKIATPIIIANTGIPIPKAHPVNCLDLSLESLFTLNKNFLTKIF